MRSLLARTERAVSEALRLYGAEGDGSYECVSLCVRGGVWQETKTYRFCKGSGLADMAKELPEGTRKALSACGNETVSLFEFSKKETGGKSLYRVSYKVRMYLSPEERNRGMEDFFRLAGDGDAEKKVLKTAELVEKTLSPRRSSVSNLGLELDGEGNTVGIKAYFSLRPFREGVGLKEQFPRIGDLRETVDVLWESFGLAGAQKEELMTFAKLTGAYGYYPFLCGINLKKAFEEYKIYFVLHPKDRFGEKSAETELEVLKKLHLTCESGDSLRELDRMNQVLRGFCLIFSKDRDTGLNLYFGNQT